MTDTLTHYGVKGMKWGVRNYQNPDGSLTPAGKERYSQKTYDVDAVSSAAPSSSNLTGLATTKSKWPFVTAKDKKQAKLNLTNELDRRGLLSNPQLRYKEKMLNSGAIEYVASYYDASQRGEKEFSIDELDALEEAIAKDKIWMEDREAKRKEINEKLDKVKEMVDKVLVPIKNTATKIRDAAKSAIDYGVLVVEEIFKRLVHKEVVSMRNDVLVHHGILGQKWGVRRYQNEDGSLTPAGKKRYAGDGPSRTNGSFINQFLSNENAMGNAGTGPAGHMIPKSDPKTMNAYQLRKYADKRGFKGDPRLQVVSTRYKDDGGGARTVHEFIYEIDRSPGFIKVPADRLEDIELYLENEEENKKLRKLRTKFAKEKVAEAREERQDKLAFGTREDSGALRKIIDKVGDVSMSALKTAKGTTKKAINSAKELVKKILNI